MTASMESASEEKRKSKRRGWLVMGCVATLIVAIGLIIAYAATASTSSVIVSIPHIQPAYPSQFIRGQRFDRFVQIWLENQDFDIAEGDRMFSQ